MNLEDEYLIPTSHVKIRSYVNPFDVDSRQIRAHLQELKHIVEMEDVAGLVLLLKELIPDYNPTSRLLNDALQTASKQDEPMKDMEPARHAERLLVVGQMPVVLMN